MYTKTVHMKKTVRIISRKQLVLGNYDTKDADRVYIKKIVKDSQEKVKGYRK